MCTLRVHTSHQLHPHQNLKTLWLQWRCQMWHPWLLLVYEEAGINMLRKGYKLSNCILNAVKRESEAINKEALLSLAPRQEWLQSVVAEKHTMVNQAVYDNKAMPM